MVGVTFSKLFMALHALLKSMVLYFSDNIICKSSLLALPVYLSPVLMRSSVAMLRVFIAVQSLWWHHTAKKIGLRLGAHGEGMGCTWYIASLWLGYLAV